MYACPLCNGLGIDELQCHLCESPMIDQGRTVDFMGDYIPYLDYEGTKLIDGDPDSKSENTCVHLYQCPSCDEQQNIPIQEI